MTHASHHQRRHRPHNWTAADEEVYMRRHSHHPQPHELQFAPTEAAEHKIGLARARLLCGRTIEEVDGIHAVALGKVAPRASAGLRLLDLSRLGDLLAELDNDSLEPDEDDLLGFVMEHLHSSWGRECRLALEVARKRRRSVD